MSDIRHAIEPEEMMAYLDGELPAARAAEAMTHLAGCDECRTLAADLRRISQEMAAWQVEPPRAMAAPRGEAPQPKPGFFRRPGYVFALAACCVALALVPAFVRTRPQHQSASVASFSVDGRMAADAIAPRPSAQPLSAPRQSPPEAAPAGPMIERTATLDLAARDFDQLRTRIDALIARHHGYLAELTVNTPSGAARLLNASLRIPAAELDAALADLRQLGRVQTESQKGEDVTRQYADLVARLDNARSTEQRLTQLLAQRTGKLSDVLEVEREIDRVRGEIEQMEAQRRTTANLVAFATVQLNAGEDYQAQLHLSPDSTLTRLRNAAVEGYKNVADGLIGAALLLISYGPTVLLWGALAFFLGRWMLRRSKSRR